MINHFSSESLPRDGFRSTGILFILKVTLIPYSLISPTEFFKNNRFKNAECLSHLSNQTYVSSSFHTQHFNFFNVYAVKFETIPITNQDLSINIDLDCIWNDSNKWWIRDVYYCVDFHLWRQSHFHGATRILDIPTVDI